MSPKRIDNYDSLEAPKADSLVPAVNVFVVNDAGEILLIRRTDNAICPPPREPPAHWAVSQYQAASQAVTGVGATCVPSPGFERLAGGTPLPARPNLQKSCS